jgi:anti-sigma regulatory factor (Ser/Thr protein kinase)
MPETLSVQADLNQLGQVTAWADACIDRLALPRSAAFAVHLCLEEALSNIARHGFPGGDDDAVLDRRVHLTLTQAGQTVELKIEDHGIAFNPLHAAAPAMPASLDAAVIGGLGIHLLRQFTQDMSYVRQGSTNRLTLRIVPIEADG